MFRIELNKKVKERIRQHRYTEEEMDALYLEVLRLKKCMLIGWRRSFLMFLVVFMIFFGGYLIVALDQGKGRVTSVDRFVLTALLIFFVSVCAILYLYFKLFWVKAWQKDFINLAKEFYWNQPRVWEKTSWNRATMRKVSIKGSPKYHYSHREQVLESLPYTNSGPIEREKLENVPYKISGPVDRGKLENVPYKKSGPIERGK